MLALTAARFFIIFIFSFSFAHGCANALSAQFRNGGGHPSCLPHTGQPAAFSRFSEIRSTSGTTIGLPSRSFVSNISFASLTPSFVFSCKSSLPSSLYCRFAHWSFSFSSNSFTSFALWNLAISSSV